MAQIILPLSKRLLRAPVVKAALSERLCDASGAPWAAYQEYYQHFCTDQRVGMVITGHVAVSAEGRAESFQACAAAGNLARAVAGAKGGNVDGQGWVKDVQRNQLKDQVGLKNQLKDQIHVTNLLKDPAPAPLIAQLSHAGPQAPLYMRPRRFYGFCAVSGGLCFFKRRNFKLPDKDIKAQFVRAALVCARCGFDGIELHAAHGYLLDQCYNMGYLSYIIDIIKSAKDAVDDDKFVIGVKVSAGPHLWELFQQLRGLVDFVEVSKGSYSDPMALVDNQELKPALRAAEQLKRRIAEFEAREAVVGVGIGPEQAGQLQPGNENDANGGQTNRSGSQQAGKSTLSSSTQDQPGEGNKLLPWPLIVATGGFRTIQEGENAVNAGQCDLAGFGRLFSLPGQESVTRLEMRGLQGWIVKTVGKLLPLVNAGPQTVWYQENMRRWARDASRKPAFKQPRSLLLWWAATLLGWVVGAVRFAARPTWE